MITTIKRIVLGACFLSSVFKFSNGENRNAGGPHSIQERTSSPDYDLLPKAADIEFYVNLDAYHEDYCASRRSSQICQNLLNDIQIELKNKLKYVGLDPVYTRMLDDSEDGQRVCPSIRMRIVWPGESITTFKTVESLFLTWSYLGHYKITPQTIFEVKNLCKDQKYHCPSNCLFDPKTVQFYCCEEDDNPNAHRGAKICRHLEMVNENTNSAASRTSTSRDPGSDDGHPIPDTSGNGMEASPETTVEYEQYPAPNGNSDPNPPEQEQVITIVVIGRSGSGVSSTIRELIGASTTCKNDMEGNETLQNIYEYTISRIPGADCQIKLVDIPGFVDGRTLEQEAQILATWKSYYLQVPTPPAILLALSRFDDNRYTGAHSLFTQFLKRIELFQNEFLGKLPDPNKMNIIFLLTRLMSETRSIQRKPSDKIKSFERVIQEFTSFPPPYSIVVGDNNANSEHNAKIEGGYYRLPNREHYPRNVWEATINATEETEEVIILPALEAIRDNREVEMKCEAKLIPTSWQEYNSDVDAFGYLLLQQQQQQGGNNWRVEENEVNVKIEKAFSDWPLRPDRRDAVIQKTALQLYLQIENITKVLDLPSSYAERSGFFQKSPLVSSIYAALLLDDAFELEMPEYIKQLTVGYGYDLLGDEIVLESPFKTVKSLPSNVGYRMPNFMKCQKFPFPDSQTFQVYSSNISGYFEERLKYLHFGREDDELDMRKVNFGGRVKEGFNIDPEEGVGIATLSAVKEIRILKCNLAEPSNWGELDEEFMEAVEALRTVDVYSRDSVTEWEVFFGKYGTHVVVQGYGGGRLLGSMVGSNVKKVMGSKSMIEDTLEAMLKFNEFPMDNLEKPTYGFFGGELGGGSNADVSKLYELSEEKRDKLMKDWSNSLSLEFEMLKMEVSLERMSSIVEKKMGVEKGAMVDQAIGLLLRGELVRKRRRGNANIGNPTGGSKIRQTASRPTNPTPPPVVTVTPPSQNFVPTTIHDRNGLTSTIFNANKLSETVTPAPTFNSQPRPDQGGAHFLEENRNVTEREPNNLQTVTATQQQTLADLYRQQMEVERNNTNFLIQHIRRQDKEAEERHQTILNESEKRQDVERRCSGIKSMRLECLVPVVGGMIAENVAKDRASTNPHQTPTSTTTVPPDAKAGK